MISPERARSRDLLGDRFVFVVSRDGKHLLRYAPSCCAEWKSLVGQWQRAFEPPFHVQLLTPGETVRATHLFVMWTPANEASVEALVRPAQYITRVGDGLMVHFYPIAKTSQVFELLRSWSSKPASMGFAEVRLEWLDDYLGNP